MTDPRGSSLSLSSSLSSDSQPPPLPPLSHSENSLSCADSDPSLSSSSLLWQCIRRQEENVTVKDLEKIFLSQQQQQADEQPERAEDIPTTAEAATTTVTTTTRRTLIEVLYFAIRHCRQGEPIDVSIIEYLWNQIEKRIHQCQQSTTLEQQQQQQEQEEDYEGLYPLHVACCCCCCCSCPRNAQAPSLELIAFFLDKHPAWLVTLDTAGNTPLHYACCPYHCHLDENKNHHDHDACNSQRLAVVQFLLQRGLSYLHNASPRQLVLISNPRTKWTPLHVACHLGSSLDLILFLAEQCYCPYKNNDDDHDDDHDNNINKNKNHDNRAYNRESCSRRKTGSITPLHIACQVGAPLHVIQALVVQQQQQQQEAAYPDSSVTSDVDGDGTSGRTPLHEALLFASSSSSSAPCCCCCDRCCCGAAAAAARDLSSNYKNNNYNHKNHCNKHRVAGYSLLDTIQCLLSCNNPQQQSRRNMASIPDAHGKLPLHYACEMEFFMPEQQQQQQSDQRGHDPNDHHYAGNDPDSTPPLMIPNPLQPPYSTSATTLTIPVVQALLQAYPQAVTVRDTCHGQTPLHRACTVKLPNSPRVVALLLSVSFGGIMAASLADGSHHHRLALHCACEHAFTASSTTTRTTTTTTRTSTTMTTAPTTTRTTPTRLQPLSSSSLSLAPYHDHNDTVQAQHLQQQQQHEEVILLEIVLCLQEHCCRDVFEQMCLAQDAMGRTALHVAVMTGRSLTLLRLLLSTSSLSCFSFSSYHPTATALAIPDQDGCLPLHYACMASKHSVATAPTTTTMSTSYSTTTAATSAPAQKVAGMERNQYRVVELLLSHYPAAITVCNRRGETPLHTACHHHNNNASVPILYLLAQYYPAAVTWLLPSQPSSLDRTGIVTSTTTAPNNHRQDKDKNT